MANGDVYIKSAGVLTQIGAGFDALSDTDKIALFNQAVDDQTLNAQDVLTLGKFEVFDYSESSDQRTVILNALPLPQTVLPEGLIPNAFDKINFISFVGTFSAISGGEIKILFTTDNVNYQTFDGAAWQMITDYSKGMSLAGVTTLTETEYYMLLNGASGLGLGFYINQNDVADNLYIEKMSLNVDLSGSWSAAKHGVDFDFSFITGGQMQINILTAGTYKVNYDAG